ncbi:hypothetical protein SISSUDRAFT_1118862 [Sistotremastrum suecicum HHB10207 ss-3]|uniref:Uncharacterized protein n=1 Tax=Sistotremastrum suecicum HHB10207 ss-3 TaxID=1314776 RepID=A0A166EF81_9AGAM|nr:hypothetical protein SISSUDRAFT_1118862 [Sistotremastrum suecicum HHB10207 ss-3]
MSHTQLIETDPNVQLPGDKPANVGSHFSDAVPATVVLTDAQAIITFGISATGIALNAAPATYGLPVGFGRLTIPGLLYFGSQSDLQGYCDISGSVRAGYLYMKFSRNGNWFASFNSNGVVGNGTTCIFVGPAEWASQ